VKVKTVQHLITMKAGIEQHLKDYGLLTSELEVDGMARFTFRTENSIKNPST
jgi:hypothetical protein